MCICDVTISGHHPNSWTWWTKYWKHGCEWEKGVNILWKNEGVYCTKQLLYILWLVSLTSVVLFYPQTDLLHSAFLSACGFRHQIHSQNCCCPRIQSITVYSAFLPYLFSLIPFLHIMKSCFEFQVLILLIKMANFADILSCCNT